MTIDPFAQTNPWLNPQSPYGPQSGFTTPFFQQGLNPWIQGGMHTLQPQTWFGGPGAFGVNPVLQQIPHLIQQAQHVAQTAPQLAQQIPQLVQQNPQLAQQAPQLQYIPQILQQAAQLAQQLPHVLQQVLQTSGGPYGQSQYGVNPFTQFGGFGQSVYGLGGFGRGMY